MSEMMYVPEEWSYHEVAIADASILTELQNSDPDLAEFFCECAQLLIDDMGWDPVAASKYVLTWLADTYFNRLPDESIESVRVI